MVGSRDGGTEEKDRRNDTPGPTPEATEMGEVKKRKSLPPAAPAYSAPPSYFLSDHFAPRLSCDNFCPLIARASFSNEE